MQHYTNFLTSHNCILSLIDYQPAMFFGVQSHDRMLLMHNAQILAQAAQLFAIPTCLSTIAKDGFSGPCVPELTSIVGSQNIIDRTSINAWLDPRFRSTIESYKKKKVVLGGLWTEACVLFPALELLKTGYEVYIAADACGDISLEAHERSMQRMIQAGAVPITSLQLVFELQQDWARSDTYNGVMDILKKHSPYGIQVYFSKWALDNSSQG